jgi:hypothetical protein
MSNLNVDHTKIEDFCRKHGIDFLGVFGSIARGDANIDSDVDLLVRYRDGVYPSLFEKSDLERSLGQSFGRRVDLVPQEFVDPLIKDKIYSDLQPLYGNP